jgi:hypothetical protein
MTPPAVTYSRTVYVQPRDIVRDPEFFDWGRLDALHATGLLQALRNTGSLDPVTLWVDERVPGRRRLVLLDGAHRLEAYRLASPRFHNRGVPARMVSCDWATAQQIAVQTNAREKLSRPYAKKADAAWDLVRLRGAELSKPQIAAASGVSPRTILTMKQRWAEMLAAGEEPAGNWWKDRTGNREGDPYDLDERKLEALVSEKLAEFKPAAETLRRVPDEVAWKVLERAFGKRLNALLEFGLRERGLNDEWAVDEFGDLSSTAQP